jgi:hypothetical protein
MPQKPRIGRPPLPRGVSREGRLYCRVLESEIEEIEAAALREKKKTSVWIREVLLAAARAKSPKDR